MKYFLGIDVGAAKTHALIEDETGQCLGLGNSSGGNHQGVGYDGRLYGARQAYSNRAGNRQMN